MRTIDSDKLSKITELFNEQVDPCATEGLVQVELCAEWQSRPVTQEWVDSAPVQEIVDWLSQFYQ